jgi:hypothetical protein
VSLDFTTVQVLLLELLPWAQYFATTEKIITQLIIFLLTFSTFFF